MTIAIRRAGAADAGTIAALHIASWRSAYVGILDPAYLAGPIEADRAAVWAGRLAAPRDDLAVLIAETAAGEPVGFTCIVPGADPEWGSLVDNLHARPDRRGGGIGAGLLATAAAMIGAGDMYLWVYAANGDARRFYARHGGREVEAEPSDMPEAGGKQVWRVHWSEARRRALAEAAPVAISPPPT